MTTTEEPNDEHVVRSWTNPILAEYKERGAFLESTHAYKVNLKLRSLNLASYAFSKNAEELAAHIGRYPSRGLQPFSSAVSEPYDNELSRLLHNVLASASSLISGQRVVLRTIWPKIGKEFSAFEQGEYTSKRIEVFETAEAEFLVELRNYSQHYFLPRLVPKETWTSSQRASAIELKFSLEVKPLYEWSGLAPKVKPYLEAAGDSIDLLPIIERYTQSVREFYGWLWSKVNENVAIEREELEIRAAELDEWGKEVFLEPDWFRRPGGEPPPGWNGRRWSRRTKAKLRAERWKMGYRSVRRISVDSNGIAEVPEDEWTPIYTRT
ncbi:hypothetical protein [Antrihabitans spumae]|uniref:Uncharacterized protein n=1 Tax=Antrihabitans spumae TaxID=3373370 RepID=A0ABW7KJ71_9NOCA